MRIGGRLASGIAMVGLAACAALLPKPEVEVKERAQERWNSLVAGEVRKAYEFFSPGSKAVMSAEAYEASIRKGFWKSAKVDEVVCARKDSCEVRATIEYAFRGQPVKTPLRETWVREGSEWWILYK